MKKTSISIWKDTAEKVLGLAKKENRSVSAQIDYIIQKYFEGLVKK